MSSVDPAGEKRPFGPQMSPAIFATKWLRKFRELFFYRYFHPVNPLYPGWWCVFCLEGYHHLLVFQNQAYELGVLPADYPPAPPQPEEAQPPPTSPAGVEPGLQNPFVLRYKVMLAVDTFLQRLRRLKEYGERIYGFTWQDLRYDARRCVNELLGMVETAREMGWWKVSDELRQQMLQNLQEEAERGGGIFFGAGLGRVR